MKIEKVSVNFSAEKLQAIEKALTEEASVKAAFRSELENQMYPLDYWIRKCRH